MQAFEAKLPPLVTGSDGVVRVAGTRVPLETLVFSFDSGATAEEIAQQYPSLSLADVYAVIAYVLANPDSVRAYVTARATAAAALRTEIERSQPSAGIRARLVARRPQVASE